MSQIVKNSLRGTAVALALLTGATAFAAIKVGDKAAVVKLDGEAGSRVDGKAWSSDTMNGKVQTLFYVDPDEKDSNEEMNDALAAAKFPKDKYGSVAVINMEATWLPNAAIASSLESKQEKFPDVVYVKDLKKALVKQWGLKDDAYVVVVFDKQGKVLLVKDGVFTKDDTKKLLETIKAHLEDPAT